MTSYLDIFGNQTVPPSEAAYIRHTITANGQLVWPYNYGGTDLLTADITEISASAGLTVTLPPANEVSVGQDILIRNVGANTVSILDFDGGAITTVDPGTAKYFYVTDNNSQAGIWAVFTYGAGTSGADSNALSGYGLQPNSSNKIQVFSDYRGVNSNTSVSLADRAKVIEVVTGSITLTLPQASLAGNGYAVMVRNSSAGNATIEGFGTEQVDGNLNKTLFPNESAIFICNGTYWISVGYGRDAEFVFSEIVLNAALTNITLSSGDVAGRMIRLSGTATGNVTVNLPSIDNVYFVNVESGLGGFTCTFTTGSGSNVVMTANQKTVIYCDGTNVSTAITTSVISTLSLNDGSAGAPVVTFALDSNTGFYRSGEGTVGFTSNGASALIFNSDGIEFTPTGNITSNNVASALIELDSDLTSTNGALATVSGNLNAHLVDTFDAHDASAISNIPSGSIAAIDVQSALNELDSEKAPIASPTFSGTVTIPTGNVTGNLGFTGTGNRIIGDFTNGSVSNRVLFQTNTVNSQSNVGSIPNGTSNTSAFTAYNSSSANNCALSQLSCDNLSAKISSGVIGAGAPVPLAFYTNALERMRIATDGKVGIGPSPTFSYNFNVKQTGGPTISGLFETDQAQSFIAFKDAANSSDISVRVGSFGNNLAFVTSSTERMRIDESGNIGVGNLTSTTVRMRNQGIGTTSSTYSLVCYDSASTVEIGIRDDGQIETGLKTLSPFNNTTATAANMVVNSSGVLQRSTSSRRYKTDITDSPHGLADVLKLRSVLYRGVNDGDKVFGGMIAEEVHDAGLHEFVQYDEQGQPDALHYSHMVALLVKSIQEQQAIIDNLNAKIEVLMEVSK